MVVRVGVGVVKVERKGQGQAAALNAASGGVPGKRVLRKRERGMEDKKA